MSIIKFTCATVGGALNPVNGPIEKIRVGKNQEAEVILSGFIGAGRVKQGEDFVPSAYGRLPVKAALVGEGTKTRYFLEIAGGLRGVLFRNADKGNDERAPDYVGNIEVEGDMVYPLFGRKVKSENGEFVSLSSGEIEAKRSRGNGQGNGSDAPTPEHDSGTVIPF
jgi:hypothetical protein